MSETFGERLTQARVLAGYRTQQALADRLGKSDRTIRNYEAGRTKPDPATLADLRELLGPFDTDGDPVETAVRRSRLTEDRQYEVVGYYKRKLREQDAEEGRAVG